MRMTNKNLYNIRQRFQEETGVMLTRKSPVVMKKIWILAAAVVCCVAMMALGLPLFSSLDGDELSLTGKYEGDGIVTVYVENRSDKILRFQPKTKLMRWVTSQEVQRLSGDPAFQNLEFQPHSEGIMRIDLSDAYDVEALENAHTNAEWFYLVLTNNEFLFGQDWMCSITFGKQQEENLPDTETASAASVEQDLLNAVEEDLRFYFEASYTDTLMAFNEANFLYQQKVDEILTRFDGTIVSSLSPVIMVGAPSELLDPEPVMEEIPDGIVFDPAVGDRGQACLTTSEWGYTDARGRMVATIQEKAWIQTAILPQHAGQTDGGVSLPLVFLFVYDSDQAIPGNHAFIYGRILSFGELEEYKVLADEYYTVYDATDLIYTDVDAYLDDFLVSRQDVYCDEGIRQRVHKIRDFYRDPENIRSLYGYRQNVK